ncbi:hypothetical protein H2O64_16800 [Kordia sp. YSTF-M3]|uniref:Uncharacterized protein n=1 Tax=Kordia aestuariivivens TaxID=2759037 RepID=A0ABR7QD65_9FLAO|nr:hypothetical protein [Kordia aestuariivivens]MBC8756336.1 hypothetical protein [Kordia aestuariivivens]
MQDNILYNLILYVEITTAIVASIYFYKYKSTYLKYFIIYLWYIAINEAIGKYSSEVLAIYNLIIYNIYLLISFSFLFSVYWNFLKYKKYKKTVFIFGVIYIIFFTVNGLFFENYTKDLVTYPFIMASCFLIITVTFYFIEILNSEKVLNVTRDLLFWISVGVVLFNIGVIPWVITLKHYSESFAAMNTLFRVLILILNICYIVGFICSHKIQKQETSLQ